MKHRSPKRHIVGEGRVTGEAKHVFRTKVSVLRAIKRLKKRRCPVCGRGMAAFFTMSTAAPAVRCVYPLCFGLAFEQSYIDSLTKEMWWGRILAVSTDSTGHAHMAICVGAWDESRPAPVVKPKDPMVAAMETLDAMMGVS